jgi:hypothetical protein
MLASMKMTIVWDVGLCSLIEIDQCFKGAYCLHHRGPGDEGSKLPL